MSNYDWHDNWDPDEDLKRDAEAGHCGKLKEHDEHVWGVTYNKDEGPRPRSSGFWSTYEGAPYHKCPGTEARAERFKDMVIHFHDDGKVTWSKPENVELALFKIQQNREEAARVAFSKEE